MLHAMHKYSLSIIINQVESEEQVVVPLPNTTFIAVPTYQSSEMIKFKITKNPAFTYQPTEEEEHTVLPLSPPRQSNNYSSREEDIFQGQDSVCSVITLL